MHRRTLMKLGVSVAVLLPLREVLLAAAGPGDFPPEAIATLRAVAAVVLPASLGGRGTDQAAQRFVEWVRAYRAGELMDHGYGRTRVRRTPESPREMYVDQLAKLEAAAAAQGHVFDRLPRDAREALVAAALEEAKVQNLPPRPNGQHVIADLMTFYFSSSEANDICYRAHIGRLTCRSPELTFNRPRPL